MQFSKNNWPIRFHKALIFLFILTISSCGGECKKRPLKKQVSDSAESKAVILFHGLNEVGSDGKSKLEGLKEKLSKDLPGVKVIALARTNSVTASLDQQVIEAYEAFKNEGVDKKEIILFGQSQGAALAAGVWAKYRKDLQIKKLIFDRGPVGVEGCPAVNVSDTKVQALKEQLRKIIPPAMPNSLSDATDNLIANLVGFHGPGVSDMAPNSLYLKKINTELENIDIPILVIAGMVEDFKKAILSVIGNLGGVPISADLLKIVGIQDTSIEDLRKSWNSVIGNDKSDLLIPLSSQILSNIKNTNIHRTQWRDLTHFTPISGKIYTEALGEIKKSLDLS